VFQDRWADAIGTPAHQVESNSVLEAVRPGLEELGFDVERTGHMVNRPVLYGENGQYAKQFNIDAFHSLDGAVVEVEAGGAVANRAYAIDLLKATVIQDARWLAIAVCNGYWPKSRQTKGQAPAPDYDTVVRMMETLFASDRFVTPLDGVAIIGY
jgi:hypothetical protein